MNNREKLINIMFDNDLDRQDISELVSVDRQTVNSWLAPGESTQHLEVPDMAIELLTLKLKVRAGLGPTAPEGSNGE